MKKRYNTAKFIFLAFFVLSIGICIYDDVINSNVRCLINLGVVVFMMNAYLEKKDYIRKLEENQSRLNTILQNIPVPAFFTEPDGEYISGNKMTCKLFNSTPKKLSGKNIFTTLLEQTEEEVQAEITKLITDGTVITSEHFLKFENENPSWYEVYKYPVLDNWGNLQRIAVFIRNMGAEKELKHQQEYFIATLTHDLKTPILAQTRSLNMLLKDSLEKTDRKELLELTLDSCNMMYNMVSTILNSYKFDNNEIKIFSTHTNIVELTMDCCDELANAMKEKNIKVSIIPKLSDYYVFADRKYLKSAIFYLIDNSISYAYEDTEIRIDLTENEGKISFEVHAESPYIPQATLNSMFDKYLGQTAHYSKIGFCMKLYYTKQIINAHNGEIIAYSEKSDYNTLGFKIPKVFGHVPAIA